MVSVTEKKAQYAIRVAGDDTLNLNCSMQDRSTFDLHRPVRGGMGNREDLRLIESASLHVRAVFGGTPGIGGPEPCCSKEEWEGSCVPPSGKRIAIRERVASRD